MSCGEIFEVFSILHQGQLHPVGKDHLQLLAVSFFFSQPSDEVMQLVTHVRDIYMTRGMCTVKTRRQLSPVPQC